jgi:hypothetical protein
MLSQVVFLPSYPDLPDREVRRLAASVRAALSGFTGTRATMDV